MTTDRMLPPGDGLHTTFSINGRSYTAALGSYSDMPSFDALAAEANGWVRPRVATAADTTANRPTTGLYRGRTYLDTTLAYVVVYDGANWRNPATAAAV